MIIRIKNLVHKLLFSIPILYLYESILIIAIWLLIHHPLWGGSSYLGWDAVRESWGDMQYGARALQMGYFPWWNHLERAGYPFIADPQTAVFYPLSWIIYLGIYLFGAGIWVPLVRSLLHYMVAIIGIRVLGRSWGYPRWISLVMGLSYILSGRLAKAKDSAGLWTMVWLPWMIWSMQQWVKKPNLRHSCIVALIMACSFYAGYPPNLYRAALLSVAFAFYQVYLHYKTLTIPQRSHYIKQFTQYAVLTILLFVLLVSPGVIATLDHLPHSVRTQLSLREILSSRFMFFEVFDVFLPRLIRTQSYAMLYVGLLPTLATCYALIHARKYDLFWLISFILFALLACGNNAFLLPWLVKYVPTFNLWRISEQYLFVAVFAWLVLAMRGAYLYQRHHHTSKNPEECSTISDHDYETKPHRYAQHSMLVIVGMYVVVCLVFLLYRYQSNGWDTLSMRLFYSVCTLSAIVLAFKSIGRIPFYVIGSILVLIQCLDLYWQQAPIYNIMQATPNLTRDRLLPKNLAIGQRIADDQFFRWRVAARSGQSDFIGRYSTMVGARYQRYRTTAQKYPVLWSHAAVQVYAGRKAHKQAHEWHKKRFKTHRHNKTHRHKQAPNPLKKVYPYYYKLPTSPYAYWTSHVYSLTNSRSVLDQLAHSSMDDVNRFALIEESKHNPLVYAHSQAIKPRTLHKYLSARSSNLTPVAQGHRKEIVPQTFKRAWGQIQFKINTSHHGLLVIREAWNPHWTVQLTRIQPTQAQAQSNAPQSIDSLQSTTNQVKNTSSSINSPSKIYTVPQRVNYLFQGIDLPAGTWQVDLIYEHVWLKRAMYGMLFTFIFILICLVRQQTKPLGECLS